MDEKLLGEFANALFERYGRQHWWPAQSRFEVIVGAYLTQNTSWGNVEQAIRYLRRANKLSVSGIREIPIGKLERLIRPSGFFRQKSQALKTFVRYLYQRHGGSLDRMFALPTSELRKELLVLKGVGPETADSILLYAGGHEVFVVDAYTRRILKRHGMPEKDYERIRSAFEGVLRTTTPILKNIGPRHPPSRMSKAKRSRVASVFNEAHAGIVRVGTQYCRSKAMCAGCPLEKFLESGERTGGNAQFSQL